MGSTVLSFAIGNLIGIGLFLVCVRSGLIHKWSGLPKETRPTSVELHLDLGKKAYKIGY